MTPLRFKPGDMAILLYCRTLPYVKPHAGTIVHVDRICIIEDAWDDLPCHYVVTDAPVAYGSPAPATRYVMDCQLMPLKGDEKDTDAETHKELETDHA